MAKDHDCARFCEKFPDRRQRAIAYTALETTHYVTYVQ